jgi:hypothetical protein
MGLTLPVPTVTPGNAGPGTSYATLLTGIAGLTGALGTIDSHNHLPGFGAPIPTGAISINANLPFGGYAATNLAYVSFNNAAQAGNNLIYFSGGNLYINNGTGTGVQITNGSSVVGAAGNIGGMSGTTSVTYNGGTSTFVFLAATGVAGLIDAGAIWVRPNNSVVNGVQLLASSSMATSYTLTLPTALPANTGLLQMSSTGAVSVTALAAPSNSVVYLDASQVPHIATPDSTITLSGSTIQVAAGGITTTQLASGSVTQAKRAALPDIGPTSSSGSSSAGVSFSTVTNQTTGSLTTTGRWVEILIQPDGSANPAAFYVTGSGGVGLMVYQLLRDGATVVATWEVGCASGASAQVPGAMTIVDTGATAGTHTYTLQQKFGNGTTLGGTQYVVMLAYEL